jgi:hypothetical protein
VGDARQRLRREAAFGDLVPAAPGEWGEAAASRRARRTTARRAHERHAPAAGRRVAAQARPVGRRAARGPRPEDLDVRLRADESSRRAVLTAYTFAIVWLLVGSRFGEMASLKLHWPDLLTGGRR